VDRVNAGEIAAVLGGELVGDPLTPIARIAPLQDAPDDSISFLANPRYRAQLDRSAAACVIVAPALRDAVAGRRCAILCADPYLAYARLSQWWVARWRPPVPARIHPSALVASSAQVEWGASIGALAVIGERARIGRGAVIGPHCVIGDDARIGEDTRLASHVVVGDRCTIGARGIVHPGVVIGADGFGFAPDGGRWVKIEQLGAVRIGDDVEIGANTCIDRGALGDTVIEEGVKLDNLIQIGHNVHIGAHTAMAGNVGVAGSARIGRYCTIAGAACILGHLELVDHVHVSVATVVTRSILQPGHYSGIFPFDDNAAWEKNAATLRHLHEMRHRLRALEAKNR
jgi:UDP-3-O-[3-hydroxymyristoyl] glucosamine N-acyltransferase